MALPANFLDELRSRSPIATVIGRVVKLTRSGRERKGCCPFHGEKTPSFYVYDEQYAERSRRTTTRYVLLVTHIKRRRLLAMKRAAALALPARARESPHPPITVAIGLRDLNSSEK